MAVKANDRILMTVFTGRLQIFVGRNDVFKWDTVQGAVERSIKFTFKDQDGNAIDLSGSAAARCTMVKTISGTRKFNQQALASLDSSGNAQYNWASSDLDEPGVYEMEIELDDDADGTYYPIPEKILINVRRKLAS